MSNSTKGLSWGVERRLQFIEFQLYWEGGINRADITEHFGVSVPQASKDLTLYQECAPGNMNYDKSLKRYLATGKFRPKFIIPDTDTYLSQLRLIAERVTSAEETWVSHVPQMDCLPIPNRRVEPQVMRALLAAIRDQRALEIQHRSMNPNRPGPVWREISPHAFANDGLRWHVRAYCHIDGRFKDFLLSRCLDARITGPAVAFSEHDRLWNETIDIVLTPNPSLSSTQRETIAADYSMDNHTLTLPIRKALIFYFLKRLRIAAGEPPANPVETPIVVANLADLDAALTQP